jgi:cation:H+ antiporter
VSSWVSVGVLVLGLVLVVAGADLFFDALLVAAGRLGVSAFLLTVIVSGFELENLAAGIAANLKGLPDAAAGTFLGGTTFLALGVAGLGALLSPLRPRPSGRALVWTAAAGIPLLALGLDGTLTRLDGGVLLAWFGVALTVVARAGGTGLHAEPTTARGRYVVPKLLAGLGLLTAGGELLGEGIRRVVGNFGISEALLGNTAVAASVEAEEVARVVTPARRGRPDVALGNILGTIVHFVGLNAGVIALVKPIELSDVSVRLHLPVAAASAPILAAMLAWRGGLGRSEGAFLILLYAGYVVASVLAAVLA